MFLFFYFLFIADIVYAQYKFNTCYRSVGCYLPKSIIDSEFYTIFAEYDGHMHKFFHQIEPKIIEKIAKKFAENLTDLNYDDSLFKFKEQETTEKDDITNAEYDDYSYDEDKKEDESSLITKVTNNESKMDYIKMSTTELTFHAVGLCAFIFLLAGLTLIIVILFYRFYVVVIYRWNKKHTVPNYRDVILKSKQANLKKLIKDDSIAAKTLLTFFQTIWSYLQPGNQKSLIDEAFQSSFTRLCQHYNPETGQSIKAAFHEDFDITSNLTEEEILKLVMYGSVPDFRIPVLSAEEFRKQKEEQEKRKNTMNTMTTITQ